jgi:flagellar basal-body rod protein FlgC
MDYFKATEISAAAMVSQKARIEAATLNLANMHTSSAPGVAGYRPLTAVIHAATRPLTRTFEASFGDRTQPFVLTEATVLPRTGETTRLAYEPGHPHADASGRVAYPKVDPAQEMMTVMTALRAYEANLSAMQAARSMTAKALEIGQ